MPESSKNRERQTEYAKRQRELGRKARKFWLTDDEREAVAEFIEQMRQSQDR